MFSPSPVLNRVPSIKRLRQDPSVVDEGRTRTRYRQNGLSAQQKVTQSRRTSESEQEVLGLDTVGLQDISWTQLNFKWISKGQWTSLFKIRLERDKIPLSFGH